MAVSNLATCTEPENSDVRVSQAVQGGRDLNHLWSKVSPPSPGSQLLLLLLLPPFLSNLTGSCLEMNLVAT